MAVGGEQREGVQQVPADPHSPLASWSRPWPPLPLLRAPQTGCSSHPEIPSQHGSPSKVGPTAAWIEGKPLLKQLAL